MAASLAASPSFVPALPRLAVVALLLVLICGGAGPCVDGARLMREEGSGGGVVAVARAKWGAAPAERAGTTGASGAGVARERRRAEDLTSKAPVPPSGPSKKHD